MLERKNPLPFVTISRNFHYRLRCGLRLSWVVTPLPTIWTSTWFLELQFTTWLTCHKLDKWNKKISKSNITRLDGHSFQKSVTPNKSNTRPIQSKKCLLAIICNPLYHKHHIHNIMPLKAEKAHQVFPKSVQSFSITFFKRRVRPCL